jgi:hypothetical protein
MQSGIQTASKKCTARPRPSGDPDASRARESERWRFYAWKDRTYNLPMRTHNKEVNPYTSQNILSRFLYSELLRLRLFTTKQRAGLYFLFLFASRLRLPSSTKPRLVSPPPPPNRRRRILVTTYSVPRVSGDNSTPSCSALTRILTVCREPPTSIVSIAQSSSARSAAP